MKIIYKTSLFILLFCLTSTAWTQIPFNKGINLTGWFQVGSPGQIQFTRYTKHDLENIKSLGCDVIRLPIALHEMSSGAPDYTLSPLFLNFMDSVVNWAEQLHIYLILDDHSFDPSVNTSPTVETVLKKVWPQMASHYKDRSNYILYEVLNEPHGISTQSWGVIQQNVINSIRAIDTKHTIIVGGSGYNTYTELQNLPVYADTNLIYTFHFYDPFMFTHQGTTWNTPSMASLEGVPFPYDAATMPPCPSDLLGTWVESALNNYPVDGTVAKVKQLLDYAVNFKNSRNVKVFCGEFGVYIPNCDSSERVYWYQVVKDYLEEKGIPWTTWDYQGTFGLFRKGTNQMFDHDLNIPLLEVLDFNVPPQTPWSMQPDTAAVKVYSDFIERGINNSSYTAGTIDFYSGLYPNNNNYCIDWRGFSQYNSLSFDFLPDRDFSYLAANNYALDFMVRGNESDISFDARFMDTKTDNPADHPWRMGVTIDASVATWDNRWHHVHIPLSEFDERGSWDNGSWFNANGEFDWSAIDKFEFSTEYGGTSGNKIWFDNIMITNLDTAVVWQNATLGIENPAMASNLQMKILPNPVQENATISYSLFSREMVNIDIYTITGTRFCRLFSGNQEKGAHSVNWNCYGDSGIMAGKGIYICRISTMSAQESCMIVKS
ncbi:MAG: cellulase family glycosylhydrolase [Bacteroidales bacterium]|nr:cellulase family glycosylhydrolase [Bacteroidales bacterium]